MVVKNHVIPSGLRQPTTIGIIGNGMLVNAQRLADELQALSPVMADLSDRVFVSDRAHLILPLHRVVDATQEDAKELTGRALGTTRRGIGPANVSKVNRIGIRVGEGYSVLFEGAQGPLIDLEQGIYPYVTTSPTTIHSVASGGGFDISRIDHRMGVLKVYQTMVGNGAFVSEDHADVGQQLRLKGEEFGSTTGRSRRCGWLDLLHARWAVDVNHFTSVVLTKLDVLDTFERIGVCVAYELDGRIIAEFEPDHDQLCRCRPVYRYFDGWLSSTRHLATYDALPDRAREFVDFIADHLGVEVGAVTKGPRDSDMLDRGHWHGAGEDNLAAFMAGRTSYEEFCELDAQLLAGESYAGLSRTAAGVPFRQGVEALFCHLTASGYRIALISTGLLLLTNHVEERFPVDLCVANDLAVDGDRCTGAAIIEIGDNEKGEHAQRAIRSFGADYVVAIGDSAGDLPMFDVADLSIAVGLTSPTVAAAAGFYIGDSDLSAVCGLL